MSAGMYLCQVRLDGDWQTHSSGSHAGSRAWAAQVAPRLRAKGYATRVIEAEA